MKKRLIIGILGLVLSFAAPACNGVQQDVSAGR